MVKQYYKIGEVSKILSLKTSVLRFWESEFRQLNPVKSASGQRYYTSKHIEFLKNLKNMLYVEKYTIEGAKKKLREVTPADDNSRRAEKGQGASSSILSYEELKNELNSVLDLLR